MAARSPAIGIDLGTTGSSVAFFYINGVVDVIQNERDNITTPSFVSFTKQGRVIGEDAKNQAATNPENTIFAAKRLIGCRYDDIRTTSKLQLPFKIINENNRPKILVKHRQQNVILAPEEVSAMILGRMKEMAEQQMGRSVEKAVITVPAHFTYSQRQATLDAARIAGLQVLRIINEPTAAALAYRMLQPEKKEQTLLMFDLGGGFCNVTIVTIENNIFQVLATAGDDNLGGEDFDERLMNHFIKEFKDKHKKDLTSNKRALNRLRIASEKAKRVLSSCTQTVVELDSLFDGIDFYTTLTRKQFEEINGDLFKAVLAPVERCLKDAKMAPRDIDDVILVGGSTRIPMVQKHLQEFFRGKELNKSMISVEAVAYGAAIQAAILNGNKSKILKDWLLFDVISSSLGIESQGGVMTPIIKRNTTVPTTETYTHTLYLHNENFVNIRIFEGDRALVKDNNFLGEFQVSDVPADGRNVNIDVTFDICANGLLTVTAIDKTVNSKSSERRMTISGHVSEREMERMVQKFQKFRQDDDKQKEIGVARNNLESYCYQVKDVLEKKITGKFDQMLTWLDSDEADCASKEDFVRKQKELEDFYSKMLSNETEVDVIDDATVQSKEKDLDMPRLGSFDKLKCSVCKSYLSYFPIHILPNNMAICGRCSLDNETNTHDIFYESVAEFVKFPCMYESHGCLECLLPVDVPNHEKECRFRTIPCTNCTWKGTVEGLLPHFEESHPDFVLRNGEFEVDFSTVYEICNLLVYKDEIFTFKRKFEDGVLRCSVSYYYRTMDSSVKYAYEITFQNGTKSLSIAYPQKPVDSFEKEDATEVSSEEIKTKLNDPFMILAAVKIVDPDSCNKEQPKPRSIDVNYAILSELECPVCFHYIVPPIYQCDNGHSICENCKERISICPLCKRVITHVNNVTLEKLANLLTYPCRFKEYGCDYVSKPVEIKEHQKYCPKGPYECPLNGYQACSWKKPIVEMFSHVLSSHQDNVLEINTVSVYIDSNYFENLDRACYVIRFGESLFKMQYFYQNKVFKWSMQLIGPRNEAGKYQFEIDINDNSGGKRKMFLRSICAPLMEKNHSFDNTDCFVFVHLEQVKAFITDVFTYKVRIL